MKVLQTAIPGVLILEPRLHRDARGFFYESYQAARYAEQGLPERFVQDNHSLSIHGTLRGLHAQHPRAQAKLVRVVEGSVFDVAVDARKGSPHFGEVVGAELSAVNRRQLFVPAGFLHGFCVTSDVAQVEYKCDEVYHREDELSVAWDDPDLDIPWPVASPLLSDKDRQAPRLRDLHERLVEYQS